MYKILPPWVKKCIEITYLANVLTINHNLLLYDADVAIIIYV